jgi:hypothetical protein
LIRWPTKLYAAHIAAILVAVALSWPSFGTAVEDNPVANPVELVETTTGVSGAGIALDEESGFHVFWTDSTGRALYRAGALGLMSVQQEIKIRNGIYVCADPTVAMTATRGAAMAWSAYQKGALDAWDIFYINSSLTFPLRITADAIPDVNPSLGTDGDQLYIVWARHDTLPEISYVVATPQRPTSLPLRLSLHDDITVDPSVAVGPKGTAWVAWTVLSPEGANVWVAGLRGDSIMSPPLPIRQGDAVDTKPSITVDTDGRPHVVWQSGDEVGSILYSYGILDTDGRAVGFIPPVEIARRNGRNPHIAILSDAIIQVCWEDTAAQTMKIASLVAPGALTLISPRYEPSQAIVDRGLVETQSGSLIALYVGIAPATGSQGIWIAPFGEAPSEGLIDRLEATANQDGSVRLSWHGDPTGIDRYVVKRRTGGVPVTATAGEIRTASTPGWTFSYIDSSVAAGRYIYIIQAIGRDGRNVLSREVFVNAAPSPTEVGLRTVPNPFNPRVRVEFISPYEGDVRVDVFDVSGRLVRTLVRGEIESGTLMIVWDGRDHVGRLAASGVYVIRASVVSKSGLIARRTTSVTLLR